MRVESFFDSARAISLRARDFRRLQCREIPVTAVGMIVGVVRSAALSSALAWLATFLCSLGNVLTPVRKQSYPTFIAATILWTHLLLSSVTLVTLALVLQSQRFVDAPDVAPTLRLCFWKLAKRTYLQFLGSLVLMISATFLLGIGSSSLHAVKLEYYLNCLFSHLFTTYADLMTRRIVRDETVQGRKYTEAKRQQTGHLKSTVVPTSGWRWATLCCRYWQHFARTSPMTLFVITAGCYVHAVSFVSRAHLQRHSELFVVGSTLFKVCVQEVAKWISLKRTVKDIRIMCVAVGIPTVLIDTQIRVVLQSVDNGTATLEGTFLMALLEIGMRVVKVGLVKLELRRVDASHAVRLISVAPAPSSATTDPVSPTLREDAARRKRKILAFQSAESYADMSGEFIAIGCSASIVYFLGSHPKYSLDRIEKDNDSRGTKVFGSSHLLMALFQVGVEIVVDWLSTMLETCGGVDFKDLLKHRGFLASFFMTLAIVNIQTSAVMYAVWGRIEPGKY